MKKLIIALITCLFLLTASSAFGEELSGWIIKDLCWVSKAPNIDSPIIGILNKGSAVTVEKVSKGWLKVTCGAIWCPVIENWIECEKCYIKESNFTTDIKKRARLWK